ncbi:MAG: NAD-dependent epimerase/dehydratase family protein [Treponema sp.]|nr:NAD-dependent epimerase/dehydratase family protein [Treponema sp.]
MKKAIYLLTGAAGYLGSNISRLLIAQNKAVRALVLRGDPAITQVPAEVEIVSGDILDAGSIEQFFGVPNDTDIIVIHCASMVTVSPELSKKLYAVNVTGTQNILDACIRHKVKKLVYVSSTGAIPELPRGQVIREINSFDPDLVIGGYGKTKAMATRLVIDAVKEHGLDASIVYPSGISGPNDYGNGYFTNFIIDYFNGKMPAGIAGSFNAVDVRDLADGVIACTEKGRRGEGYILSNSSVSMRDLFQLISSNTGAKEINTILPVSAAKVLAVLSSCVSFFTKKPGLLTSFAIYNLSRNNVFSCEKAKRELGFRVRPFEETIRDMAIWLHKDRRICIAGESARTLNLDSMAA